MPSNIFPFDTDPGIFPDPMNPNLAALIIMRRDIEKADLEPLLRLLKTFISSPDALMRYAGMFTVVVDGYNEDERDIVDIAEVRHYFELLEGRWPYLPFFLESVQGEYLLYLALVAKGRRTKHGTSVTLLPDMKYAGNIIMRFGEEMSRLLIGMGVTEDDPALKAFELTAEGIGETIQNHRPLMQIIK